MADLIRCPICGAPNSDTLERCRACNQLLEQSTKELDGFSERIASGQTPTEKSTSELEQALPAWLRHARQTDQGETKVPEEQEEIKAASSEEEAVPDNEPIFPDFLAEDDEEDSDAEPGDWLAGLASSADDDDDDEESADWLKNLQGDLPAEDEEEPTPETTSTNEDEGEDDANWLGNLQDSARETDLPDLISDEVEQDADELPGEDGVPDWLSRLSDQVEADTASDVPEPASVPDLDAQPSASDTDDDLPGWLNDLQAVGEVSNDDFPVIESEDLAPTPAVEEAASADADSDLPDWISNLQAADDAPAISEEPEAAPASDDLPDWISNLQETEEETLSPVDAAPEETPSDDLPDWLSGDTPAQVDTPIETGDELPDWMDGSEDVEELPASEEPVVAQASTEDLPDWLSGGEAAAEDTTVAAMDALPDWATDSDQAEVLGAASPVVDADLPDWLSGADAEKAESGTAVDDEQPDWLENLQESAEITSESSDESVSADLPDWMSALSADEDDVEESPEWLAGGEADSPAEDEFPLSAPAFDADIPTDPTDELPDWLAGLQVGVAQSVDASQQEDVSITEAGEQESEALIDDAEEAEVPDWLSRVGKPITGPLDGSKAFGKEDFSDLEAADEAPDWLDSLPGIDDLSAEEKKEADLASSPAFVDDAVVSSDDEDEIFGIDMPDWLSNLAPEDIGMGEGLATGDAISAEEGDLSDAELPSWVQAMRPVESVVASSDDDEQVVVESGPLAGLSGILPVGTGVGPKSKPQAHALKLRVNESQQHGAQLLENILNSEDKATARVTEDGPVSIPLLRWLIAGLMFVVLVGSLIMPQKLVPAPNIIVPEVGATLNIINQLPEGGTVLVVFDYEAALSAELQAAAAPVIDHVLLRGQKIAALSLTPNGSALAEHFMNATQSQHNYQSGVDYLNLGYLPGGASGILSFVSAPRSTIVGQIDGQSFWTLPPLLDIIQITDFSAVIILTDDVERGRAWVEQASDTLNEVSVPFLMAVSAQAEPVMYPYYASGQVDGLVSGLNGGATYERLQGQSGLGREYWDAYSIGLLTAEIMIVVGAILNFMAGLRASQNNKTEEK